jgi:3-dehydroquinate synthase
LLALELSSARGWIEREDVDQFRQLLLAMQLPVDIPHGMTPEMFVDLMGRDKKVVDGRMRLVLLRAVGKACIVDDVGEQELLSFLAGHCPV